MELNILRAYGEDSVVKQAISVYQIQTGNQRVPNTNRQSAYTKYKAWPMTQWEGLAVLVRLRCQR